jgi:hypothetical protein
MLLLLKRIVQHILPEKHRTNVAFDRSGESAFYQLGYPPFPKKIVTTHGSASRMLRAVDSLQFADRAERAYLKRAVSNDMTGRDVVQDAREMRG